MAAVDIAGLGKRFGETIALSPSDLQIADGEFVVLVGPSGCGKSTLLRMIAGLESASEGRILIGGRDVTDAPPAERGVAMVFQSYALYPHLTVAGNIAFPLKVAGLPKQEIAGRVAEAAAMLDLTDLLDRRPRDRPPAAGAAARRTALQSRHVAARADAARIRAPASTTWRDDDLCDARPA